MNKNLKPELKHLALDFFRPITKELLHTDYLHYGYWEEGVEVNFLNIKKAQQKFVDVLYELMPENVSTILDVGCGTGEVAKNLLEKKAFQITCTSPNEHLNQIARKKLGENHPVINAFFQNFSDDKQYDLILFSESFQYIPFEVSLEKAWKLLKPNGFVLIADFFRLETKEKSPIGGGHSLAKFTNYLGSKSRFTIVHESDITPQMSKTIDLRKKFMEEIFSPMAQTIHTYLSARYPKIYPALLFPFRKKILEKKQKYFEKKVDSHSFQKFKSYRIYLLQKK